MRLAHNGILNPDAKPGDIVQLEPHNGLIWSIWLAGGDVAYWQSKLQQCDPDDTAEVELLYKQLRIASKEMRAASKMALDAGLAERQVALAERMGGLIADAIVNVTSQLGLSPSQESMLPSIIQNVLTQMEAPGDAKTLPRPTQALRNYKTDEIIYAEQE